MTLISTFSGFKPLQPPITTANLEVVHAPVTHAVFVCKCNGLEYLSQSLERVSNTEIGIGSVRKMCIKD